MTGEDRRIAVLDIGGTAIKSGIWNGKEIVGLREWDTEAWRGGGYLMGKARAILSACGKVEAIGVSTAGQVDFHRGRIHYANDNLPGYTGTEVRALLEEAFHVPVAVENDVYAAALGEMHCGAAAGFSDFLCLTYGTGVGGAVVTDGKLRRGSTFAGGGFGRMLVHPQDRKAGEVFSGCYEKYASVTALVGKMKEIGPNLDSGRRIFEEIHREEVRNAVDEWIDEILYGLVTLIHCFNPSAVLLGGGIMAQPYIIEEIRRKIVPWLAPDVRNVVIRQAGLGNRAGLTGAAILAGRL